MSEFSMRPAVAYALAGAAALAAVAAVFQSGPGRWLIAVAAAALGAEAARGALLRPTLRLTDEGLDLVPGVRRIHVPWHEVEAASIDRQQRRLVRSTWLEIDTGERLLALPAYRLGAPVGEVADAVSTRRPAPPR